MLGIQVSNISLIFLLLIIESLDLKCLLQSGWLVYFFSPLTEFAIHNVVKYLILDILSTILILRLVIAIVSAAVTYFGIFMTTAWIDF